MAKNTKNIGDKGEDQAIQYLLENDFKIITRNYRTRYGEIDIIAKKDDTISFVEVKLKKSLYFGSPAEMITPRKIKKIARVAEDYLFENKVKSAWRIDALLILDGEIDFIENITS